MADDATLYALRREVLRRHWEWWELRRATGGGGVGQAEAWPLFVARQRAKNAVYELRDWQREREAA